MRFAAGAGLAYLAKQGSFEREAEQSKYNVIEAPAFQKNA